MTDVLAKKMAQPKKRTNDNPAVNQSKKTK
jgi:hypothetical protein